MKNKNMTKKSTIVTVLTIAFIASVSMVAFVQPSAAEIPKPGSVDLPYPDTVRLTYTFPPTKGSTPTQACMEYAEANYKELCKTYAPGIQYLTVICQRDPIIGTTFTCPK